MLSIEARKVIKSKAVGVAKKTNAAKPKKKIVKPTTSDFIDSPPSTRAARNTRLPRATIQTMSPSITPSKIKSPSIA